MPNRVIRQILDVCNALSTSYIICAPIQQQKNIFDLVLVRSIDIYILQSSNNICLLNVAMLNISLFITTVSWINMEQAKRYGASFFFWGPKMQAYPDRSLLVHIQGNVTNFQPVSPWMTLSLNLPFVPVPSPPPPSLPIFSDSYPSTRWPPRMVGMDHRNSYQYTEFWTIWLLKNLRTMQRWIVIMKHDTSHGLLYHYGLRLV